MASETHNRKLRGEGRRKQMKREIKGDCVSLLWRPSKEGTPAAIYTRESGSARKKGGLRVGSTTW